MATKNILIIALFLLSGCSIQERAAKKVSWVDRKSPMTLVSWCATNVPVRAETTFTPGKTITIPGVIKFINCDSARKESDSGSLVGVPCPPSTYTVDTYRVVIVDSAALMALRGRFDSMRYVVIQKDYDIQRAKGAKNTLTWVGVIAGVVALVMGVIVGLMIRTKFKI